MSILSGFFKQKKYIKTSTGYKLRSLWTSSDTVEFADGKTAQIKVGGIDGVSSTDSQILSTTNSNFVAGAVGVKNLYNTLLNKINNHITSVSDRFARWEMGNDCGNTNLDAYISSGTWYCHADAQAKLSLNFPIEKAGILIVNSTYVGEQSLSTVEVVTQTYITWDNSNYFVRVKSTQNGMKWTGWKTVYDVRVKIPITFRAGTEVSLENIPSYSYYVVQNNVCYYQIAVISHANVSTSDPIAFPLSAPLPKPFFGNYLYQKNDGLSMRIDSNGSVRITGNSNGTLAYLRGSYPIL